MHFTDESADFGSQNTPCAPCGKPSDSAERDEPAKTLILDEHLGDKIESADTELYNLRSNYYKSQNEHVIQMVTESACFEMESPNISAHEMNHLSILIDSGASRSVCGRKWAEKWFQTKNLESQPSAKQFRFGAGPSMKILGVIKIFIQVIQGTTDAKIPAVLPVRVDVVDSDVPMLISHESLCNMKGIIDFESRTLKIPNIGKIKLNRAKSGHLMIQGTRPSHEVIKVLADRGHPIYMTEMKLPVRILSKDEVAKIHVQLGHCSENALLTTTRSAQMHCDLSVIQTMMGKCGCQTAVRRITLPPVASMAAKFNGEIIALDIIYPFTDCFDEKISKEFPALFMIDSLSRFVNCALLINRASGHASQIFLDDWVGTLGKPRRIITDRGGPTLQGEAWTDLSHIFGWQMIHAPKFSPNQNGLAERSTRSLEIAVKNLITATQALAPTQEILTQAVIAKNHVPHAVTGIPPAMAMTGRCDILDGHGQTAFTHDPNASDSLIRTTNNLNNILNARNAIIAADASYAIKTMLSRKSPDRCMTHFAPGVSVQIAMKQSWIGTYRVVSVLDSNLVLERANRIFK